MSTIKILFLCTHNSARSIIAEAIGNFNYRDKLECFSAGSEPSKIRELTFDVLNEIEIPTENLFSKSLDRFLDNEFDFVITLCDEANDNCPNFNGAKKKLHWSLPDPSKATGSREQRLNQFKKVRAELDLRIKSLIDDIF